MKTVGSRFTALYAGLFLLSAIGLLVLTNLLGGWQETSVAPDQGRPPVDPAAARQIQALQEELAQVHSDQSRQLLTGSVIALLVMVVVSILLGKAVSVRVLRPLRMVTSATRRISADNLHERLAVPGPADEVKDLADTIDELLARLEASFAAQRRFVANASHELRTPLATMRAALDVAVAKPDPAPPTLVLAGRLRTELDQVDHLLADFLVLARAQHGALPDQEPVSLRSLTIDALAARERDIAVRRLAVLEEGTDGWIDASPTLLARAVDNLVANAIVHNEPGGWIRIATSRNGLVVETGGPVLDPEQVARLAVPFQRLAADRTRSETGSGLGLSIVAAVVEAHGGQLELYARPDGGLRVTVSLPESMAT